MLDWEFELSQLGEFAEHYSEVLTSAENSDDDDGESKSNNSINANVGFGLSEAACIKAPELMQPIKDKLQFPKSSSFQPGTEPV
jgi:hypothetical protein